MTKEQMSNFLREQGITVVGFKAKDQYIVRQVGEEKFSRKEQRRAHIALIHAFLAVMSGIHAQDAADALAKMNKEDDNDDNTNHYTFIG